MNEKITEGGYVDVGLFVLHMCDFSKMTIAAQNRKMVTK